MKKSLGVNHFFKKILAKVQKDSYLFMLNVFCLTTATPSLKTR